MRRSRIRLAGADRLFHVLNTAFLVCAFLVVVFPLLNIVSQSLSSARAVLTGKVLLLPVEPTLDAYRYIVADRELLAGFANSLFYTVVGTAINVTLTVMAAYPLSKKTFYGGKAIIGIFIFTMLFGGGLIPTYLLVRNLGLYDTRSALLIPNALAVWNVMIARTFFRMTIPEEMCEAAEIDGASDIRMILKIVVPLSGPIIAVLTLFYAVDHWNSYFDGLIYLRSEALLPLQVVLRNILANAQAIEDMAATIDQAQAETLAMVEVMKYAIIVVASVPVLLLYPFVQKYFVKGVMIGSIKG